MTNISKIEDTDIIQCDDCGATSTEKQDITHFESCEPEASKRWREYYNKPDDEIED